MAKSLFIFLFFSGLTTQGWSVRKYHVTKYHKDHKSQSGDVTMTKSHEDHGKVVHRPCSSYISSIQN